MLIKEIRNAKIPSIRGSFSPRSINFIGVFQHARELFEKQVKQWRDDTIAISLGVYERGGIGDDGLFINFPVLVSNLKKKDRDDYAKNEKKSQKGKFSTNYYKSAVGITLNYLTKSKGKSKPESLKEKPWQGITSAIDSSEYEAYVTFKDPVYLFKDNFLSAWGTDKGNPKYHYVFPLTLENSLVFGGIGVDVLEEDLGNKLGLIKILQENMEWLFSCIYHGYFSILDNPSGYFDPRETEVKNYLNTWESNGRVFGRKALDVISNEIDNEETQALGSNFNYCVVFYCDGNGIKDLNDSFDHTVGNEVIRILGSALYEAMVEVKNKEELPCFNGLKDGMAFRWGGDEFIVILSFLKEETNKEEVTDIIHQEIGQRYCQYVEEKLVKARDALTITIRTKEEYKYKKKLQDLEAKIKETGFSIGYHFWRKWDHNRDFRDSWSNFAEKAMYISKTMYKISRNKNFPDKALFSTDPKSISSSFVNAYKNAKIFANSFEYPQQKRQKFEENQDQPHH